MGGRSFTEGLYQALFFKHLALQSALDWSCHVGKFVLTNQKHNPYLSSDASSVWNFCARFSDVISRGNLWHCIPSPTN